MRTSLITTLAIPAALTAALTALPGAAGASTAVTLPFIATFSGHAEIAGPTTTTFTGTGYATYLGRMATDGHVQITGVTDRPCAGGVANTNTEVLTETDGDTLTVTSSDVACPVGPNRYHGSGRWAVTSGTGRFATASGKGSFDGHSDFGAGTFDTTLIGVIYLRPDVLIPGH